MNSSTTIGSIIKQARMKAGLNQRQLAARIKKEDGESISQPYLNDIENDKRSPSSDHLIEEFARVLKIDRAMLYLAAGKLPASSVDHAGNRRVINAFRAFVRELHRATAA
jgi:transcriptional regulator with XRE-family HTH domain